MSGYDDDEDCAKRSSDVQSVTTSPVAVDYETTTARQTSSSSTSAVTTTSPTTLSSTVTTSTMTHVPRPPSLPVGQVVYEVVGTTRTPFLATRGASSSATDASVPEFVDPVSMNIGLIVGVAVAIAVLLCMLAYVMYKCIMAGQRPGLPRSGMDCAEKTALGVGQDFSPPHHDHASQFAINGRPPPLLTDSLTPRTKKDVKEWYV